MNLQTKLKLRRYLSQCGVNTYELWCEETRKAVYPHPDSIPVSSLNAKINTLFSEICSAYANNADTDVVTLLNSLKRRFSKSQVTLSDGRIMHLVDAVKIMIGNEDEVQNKSSQMIVHNDVDYLQEIIVLEQIGPKRRYRFADEPGDLMEGRRDGKIITLYRGVLYLFLIDELMELLSIYESENGKEIYKHPISGIDYTLPMERVAVSSRRNSIL